EHAARVDCNRNPGLRIAPAPRPLVIYYETAEAGKLDLLAAAETLLNDRKHQLHDLGSFFFRGPHALVDQVHEIRLGHSFGPFRLAPELGAELCERPLD